MLSRSSVVFCLCLICLLFSSSSLLAEAPTVEKKPIPDLRTRKSGTDWPHFLGPNSNGKSTETGLRTPWPAGGPPLIWWREVGEGYSMPSIAKGRLFFFDRHGDQARLTCLKSETGEEIWRQEYPVVYEDLYGYSGGPRASPVVDGERVYTFGVEGRLRAHQAVDGRLLWEVDTARRFGVVQNFFGASSTPLVEGDLLIVPVGGSPADSPGIQSGKVQSNGSALVAFDKHTGKVRYQSGDELASYATPVIRPIGKRRWGFHFARDGLMIFDPQNGEVASHFPWRAKMLESVNASTPVVVDDTVLITETYGPGGALLKVKPDGQFDVLWQDPPGRNKSLQCHWNTPIYHQGYIYASSGRSSGNAELRCLEHRTGKVMWSQPDLRRSTLLYVDGHLIVLGEYGELWLIKADPSGFHQVSEAILRVPEETASAKPKRLLEHPVWNAPIVSHGLLYVRGKDRLACLEVIPAVVP